MRITVLFFGVLKDVAGAAEDHADVAQGTQLGALFDHYAGRFPRIEEMRASILLARNRQFCPASTELREGDEVAFMPPVSGGAPTGRNEVADEAGHWFALTRDPIDARALSARLLRGEAGAVVTFEGVVRNNSRGRRTLYLTYDCYEPMALDAIVEIGREIAGSHQIDRIAVVHRLGRLEIGETSVAIVVTAPHRKPAFDAALEGINRLKRRVPIWKKEYFADGETWVEGEWDESVLRGR